MKKVLRWGTIGSGWVAHVFANTMKVVTDSEIVGVADSSLDMARAYREKFDVPYVFDSPQRMVESPDIDAIYVATPHCFHKKYIELALNHGKHVLCVKPITISAQELRDVIALAESKNLMLMEAMWTRFKPEFQAARKAVRAGEIGDIKRIEMHCTFRPVYDPKSRLFDLKMGGGSLLDIGVYTVSLAQFFMGQIPERIVSLGHVGATGVDQTTSALLGYRNGTIVFITSSIETDTSHDLVIFGTKGELRINNFWYSDSYEISPYGPDPKSFKLKSKTFCFAETSRSSEPEKHDFMIDAFNNCIREGKTRCETIPLEETMAVSEIMDVILGQIGVSYKC